MVQRIQQRRGTAAQWTTANTLLSAGEIGVETDTLRLKVGNGSTLWNSLAYVTGAGGSAVTLSGNTLTVDGSAITVADADDLTAKLDATAKAADTAKVNGITVTGTPSVGQVLTASGTTAAAWSTPAAGAGDATSGGKGIVQLANHLAGTASAPQVVATALTAPLPLAQGGTGGGTATAARSALGLGGAATLNVGQSTGSVAAGDDTRITGALSATDATAAYGPGSPQWLKALAVSFGFAFTSITTTDTLTGLPTAGAVRWPDTTTGAFTGTVDGAGNGYSGWTVTWVGGTTKTVTASGVTYDSVGNPIGPTSLDVS